jgi:hypothetical protein
MNTTTTSSFLSLNWKDTLKAFILAVGTPVLYLVQEKIPGYNVDPYVKVALAAGVSYLLKNFFTSSEIVVKNAHPEDVEAVKDGAAKVSIIAK